jgi:hypothetical protein
MEAAAAQTMYFSMSASLGIAGGAGQVGSPPGHAGMKTKSIESTATRPGLFRELLR